jgi:hypothetical protein
MPFTVEWFRKHQPDMPEEVAAYQVKKMRSHRDRSQARLAAELGVESAAELASVSPDELLTRHFRSRNPAALLRSLTAGANEIPADFPLETLLGPRYQVLGAVAEGDSLAHVVYRVEIGAGSDPEPEDEDPPSGPPFVKVAALRRTPTGWRLRLTEDILSFGGLAVGIEPAESEED